MTHITPQKKSIAIIGGGSAGLMAADVLSKADYKVHVFDAMPSMARKFLRAGIGGLNITFHEPLDLFLDRYDQRRHDIELLLKKFSPDDLLQWVHQLGIQTFVGSSGRIFPVEKKAAPLLRAWLHRLRQANVIFHPRHRWLGWNNNHALRFMTPTGEVIFNSDATLLALGGASWPQLGSDASWVNLLKEKDIKIAPLRPANCGFTVKWTDFFRDKFAGEPIKSVIATVHSIDGEIHKKQGDLIISAKGIEGGLMYALSAYARDAIEKNGSVIMHLDLCPNKSLQHVTEQLKMPRGKNTIAKHLKNKVGIVGVKSTLLHEFLDSELFLNPEHLAEAIKNLPIPLVATNPIAEAISTAGGVCFEELDDRQMLKKLNGVFCAGEMLDWEAPTGGYLLSACFASGFAAGLGILEFLQLTTY